MINLIRDSFFWIGIGVGYVAGCLCYELLLYFLRQGMDHADELGWSVGEFRRYWFK